MPKPKVLFVASVSQHMVFHFPYLQWFQEKGFETHVAAAGKQDLPFVDVFWEVDFKRSPFSLSNIKAYKKLKKILRSSHFELISTHTPMASIISRLANYSLKLENTKIVYMAHGFHFFKGAPFINWIIYYPIEIIFTRSTDAIICINKEDYSIINQKGSKKCKYFLVPGVGVPSDKFYPPTETQKLSIRKKLSLPSEKVIGVYTAEFIDRKDHRFIIDAIQKHKEQLKNFVIVFAGKGILEEKLIEVVKQHKTEDIIRFIGFRKDIEDIYRMSDIGISSSKQEGLPINIVEELQTGLPLICSTIRGHNELVINNRNGFLYENGSTNDFINKLLILINEPHLRKEMGVASKVIVQPYILENAFIEITKIYNNLINVQK